MPCAPCTPCRCGCFMLVQERGPLPSPLPALGRPGRCLAPRQVSSEQEPAEPAAGGQEDGQAPGGGTLKGLGLHPPPFHSLVLDLGALSFVDTVCIKSLKNVRASRGVWGRAGKAPKPLPAPRH